MPESVDIPAPVSTTRRPCRRTSGTAMLGRSPSGRAAVASSVTGSAGVAGARPGAALLGLDLPVLGRCGRDQVVEQVLRHVCDLVDGAVEGILVRRRRAGGATDLAHELERGVVHLLRGRRWLEVVQRTDVAAHGTSLRG